MTHGLRCWNTAGSVVVDLNSRSFAILAAGTESIPPEGQSRFVPLPVNPLDPDKQFYRMAGDFWTDGTVVATTQHANGFTMETILRGGAGALNYWVLYL